MKKKVLSILLCICMALTLLPTAALAVPAEPASLLSAGSINFADGGYYVADTETGEDHSGIKKADTKPANNYLAYTQQGNAATLTVVGDVSLSMTTPFSISSGTLTIAGGNLTIASNTPAVSVNSGASLVTANGYSGNISLTSSGSYAIQNFGTVKLETAGALKLSNGTSTQPVVSGGSVALKGDTVDVSSTSSAALLNCADLSVTVTGTKGLTLTGSSNGPLICATNAVVLSVPNGKVDVENTYETEEGSGTAVSGTLTVTAGGDVNISSQKAYAVDGSANIAAGGEVELVGHLGTVNEQLTVTKAASIGVYNYGTAPALSGAVNLIADGDITISESTGNAPAISTDGAVSITSKNGAVGIFNSVNMATVNAASLTVSAEKDVMLVNTNTSAGAAYMVPAGVTPTLHSESGKVVAVTAESGKKIMTISGDNTTYAYGGDYSDKALDLKSVTAPTGYLAGSGYILWNGSSAVTLHNATIDTSKIDNSAALSVPGGILTLEGTNSLKANAYGLYAYGSLTIDGTGSLRARGTSSSIYVQKDKTLTISSGTVDAPDISIWNPADGSFVLNGGTLTGSLVTRYSDQNHDYYATVYGNLELSEDYTPYLGEDDCSYGFTVLPGTKLTIPAGITMKWGSAEAPDMSKFQNNGTIVNNGTVILPDGTAPAAIAGMKLTGGGIVRITTGELAANYSNTGTKLHTLTTALDFSKDAGTGDGQGNWKADATADSDGYNWNAETGTLTLQDLTIIDDNAGITLPSGKVKLVLNGTNYFTCAAKTALASSAGATGVTVSGTGSLTTPGSVALIAPLTMDGGTINVRRDRNTAFLCHGLTMNGGAINVDMTGDNKVSGIVSMGDVNISGGSVNVNINSSDSDSWAFVVTGNASITGGAVTLTGTGSDRYHSPHGLNVGDINGAAELSVTGGTLDVSGMVIAVEITGGTSAKIVTTGMDVTTVPAGGHALNWTTEAYHYVSIGTGTMNDGDDEDELFDLAATGVHIAKSASGGGTTGGGSTTPTGTTVTNADGSKTTTTETTKSDGTKVTTTVTTNTDNSTKSVTTTEKKQSDGSTVKTETTVTTDSAGKTTGAQATIVTGSKTGEVTVPADVITALTKVEGSTLTVATPGAEIKLNHAALEALVSKGGTAPALTITPVPFKDLPAKAQANLTEATTYSFSVNGGSVDFGSGTVTVTLNYTRKAANTVVTVYFVDNDGNMTPMPGASYKNGKVSYDTNHFSLYAIEEGTMPFTDVDVNGYCADSVLWAVKNKVTSGISATTFAPNADCTRAQAVTFLWRAMGSPESTNTKNPFTDVKSDAYYYKAVLWAVEKGITGGTTATTFSPDATVNRAQTVTFLYRAAGSPAATASKPFTDVPSVAYYADAVNWATGKGVTAGVSTTMFAPNASCTRGQIVTFLFRDLNK